MNEINFQEKISFYYFIPTILFIAVISFGSLASGYATYKSYLDENKVDLFFWSLVTALLNILFTLMLLSIQL